MAFCTQTSKMIALGGRPVFFQNLGKKLQYLQSWQASPLRWFALTFFMFSILGSAGTSWDQRWDYWLQGMVFLLEKTWTNALSWPVNFLRSIAMKQKSRSVSRSSLASVLTLKQRNILNWCAKGLTLQLFFLGCHPCLKTPACLMNMISLPFSFGWLTLSARFLLMGITSCNGQIGKKLLQVCMCSWTCICHLQKKLMKPIRGFGESGPNFTCYVTCSLN